ncbi:MAG TPA: hypothetical protein VNE60_09435 [Gemmatimonadaceae bacterium]|nr:hypothetical protein [Gemmatimonadaceae bacterium]
MRTQSPATRALAQLVGAIVVLDAIAVAVLKASHLEQRGGHALYVFVVGWTLVSALVAAWGLWRVKAARRARRGSGAPRDD